MFYILKCHLCVANKLRKAAILTNVIPFFFPDIIICDPGFDRKNVSHCNIDFFF